MRKSLNPLDLHARWDTIKKEAYGCYFGVRYFDYYLRDKAFILETDHRNLLRMEKRKVPIIVRWRVYLQSFVIRLKHIAGAKNIVADWLSRMNAQLTVLTEYEEMDSSQAEISCLILAVIGDEGITEPIQMESEEPVKTKGKKWTPEEMFAEVHGGRHFHKGARGTWMKFNQRFPGHRVRYDQIEDMVARCGICQKDRLRMTNYIEPVVRHLKPEHARKACGIDNLTVTPKDELGNEHIIVVTCHFTKHVWGMPAKSWDATTAATALFVYFCTFGLYDEVWSDPGVFFMSQAVEQLMCWLGVRHVVSLVDRHESNGVEGRNKQILRHLKTLVHDERMVKR